VGLPDLCRMLERNAEGERERILAAAGAEAERIRGEAATRAGEERARALEAHEAAWRAEAEAGLASARRQGRTRILRAQRRLLDEVFDVAAGLLPLVAVRPELIARLVEDALAYADGPTRLRCPPALAPAVSALVASRPGVTVDPDPRARSGVEAIVRDGAVVVDATLEGRLERGRAALEIEVWTHVQARGT